jgi:predicted metalloprotease
VRKAHSAIDRSDDTKAALQTLADNETLLHNQLNTAGQVAAVSCSLPGARLSTKQAILKYANAVESCLERAWKPLFERSGIAFAPSIVHAVAPSTPTACGNVDDVIVAFYCDDGHGIYFDWAKYIAEDSAHQPGSAGAIRYTMAHEFGHHLQELVGISSVWADRYGRATGAAQLEEMRRHELQASCFAAAFFGANQKTLDLYGERLADFRWHAYSGDDDPPATARDHGSRKSNTAWAQAAFKAKTAGACITWAASPARVS